jgi:hypothetical protein
MWIGGRGALLAQRRRALVAGEQRLLRSSLCCCGVRGEVWMLRASDQTFAIPTRCRRGSASALWQWHWWGVRGWADSRGWECVCRCRRRCRCRCRCRCKHKQKAVGRVERSSAGQELNKASAAARRGDRDASDCEPKKGLTKQSCAAGESCGDGGRARAEKKSEADGRGRLTHSFLSSVPN